VVLPAIGAAFMGGYYAGTIDTTKGNIIAADASQTGAKYALIVSPQSLQSSLMQYGVSTSVAAARTRWDGLTATLAMASTSYPAANYCYGLSYPSDAASRWYLPAMDELELIYRNLKPKADANYTTAAACAAGSFPYSGTTLNHGYDPSSSPAGAAYTSASPAQTTVAAFQYGGAQALGNATSDIYLWSATEYASTDAWIQDPWGSQAGRQNNASKNGSYFLVRPVRRLLL
jgi:hypothetical protein